MSDRNGWRGQISKLGFNFRIGLWDSEEDAAKAYDYMLRCLYGIFGDNMNFPDYYVSRAEFKEIKSRSRKPMSSSNYRGVSLCSRINNPWQATWNRKFLGRYKTQEEASNAVENYILEINHA